MKIYQLTAFSIDALQTVDLPIPEPGHGQVLVKMQAWSLNYRDLMMIRGLYNPKLRFPFTPLSDGAGEVAAIGPGVTRVKVGERVAGAFMQGWHSGQLSEAAAKTALGGALPGVAADYVVLDEEGVVPVPEHLSWEEAATLPCAGVTAWNAVVSSGVTAPGQTVLVQGTGGVSLFALQFAKLAGAEVVATSSSDQKLQRVRAMGASETVNYRTTPDWEVAVRKWLPEGVDHVVEVGGAGTLPRSFKAVRTGGRISLIGVLSGVGDANPLPILMKNINVQGIFVGSRAMFEAMNRAIVAHQFRPIVDKAFNFSELAAALKHMESGAHFGKICLKVG